MSDHEISPMEDELIKTSSLYLSFLEQHGPEHAGTRYWKDEYEAQLGLMTTSGLPYAAAKIDQTVQRMVRRLTGGSALNLKAPAGLWATLGNIVLRGTRA